MVIESSVMINAPIGRCFDLTRSVEFHEASSKPISAKATGGKVSGLSALGDKTIWRARFFGLFFEIETEIVEFEPNSHYTETKSKGIPKTFRHDYRFEEFEDGCRVSDRFEICSRFGVLGKCVDRVLLKQKMIRLVENRLSSIRFAAESGLWSDFIDDNPDSKP